MRVISGSLKGTLIKSPKGHKTHPMSDKMRGAIFNILGNIEGLDVLDAFSGSGALSIEAISRGAKQVLAIDIDQNAITCIKDNIARLGLVRHMKAVQANVSGWMSNNPPKQRFDLIFCDPPYDNLQVNIINRLVEYLSSDGTLVLSWPGNTDLTELPGLNIVHHKSYGDGQLLFYKVQ